MKTKIAKHSFRDPADTVLTWIACSECDRGGKGTNVDKCSNGGLYRKFNGLGCYMGTLRPGLRIAP